MTKGGGGTFISVATLIDDGLEQVIAKLHQVDC